MRTRTVEDRERDQTRWLAGEDEVTANIMDRSDDRLAGKQIVTEMDRAKAATAAPWLANQRFAALRSTGSERICRP
jgi:hypothetical protein